MKLQITCAVLFFAGISSASAKKYGPDEEARFTAFVTEHTEAYFNPLDPSLNPWIDNRIHDIFFYTPELVLGGDIWSFSFAGYSNLENLEIATSYLDLDPNDIRGGFYLNLTFPAVITGKYKLNGFWRENGTEIPLGGEEGSWTLTGKAIRWSQNFVDERRPGYLGQVASYQDVFLEGVTLDMPGLFGDDVPAHVADFIINSIREELWNVYAEDIETLMFQPLYDYLDDIFFTIPFEEIWGAGAMPVQKNVEPPAPTWPQMDKFVASVMNEFSGIPAEGLDPLRELDVSIEITYPTNLNLTGTISDLKFFGAKNIKHKSSYSPINKNAITVYSDYPNAYLEGRHNITGTITLESGEVLAVGGAERNFVFKARPASSTIYYLYVVDCETGAIELDKDYPLPASVTFELREEQNIWDIDLHGLLDDLPDGELKDTTKEWISDAIEEEVAEKLMRKIEYRIEKVLNNAFKQTTYNEIAHGSNPSQQRLPC